MTGAVVDGATVEGVVGSSVGPGVASTGRMEGAGVTTSVGLGDGGTADGDGVSAGESNRAINTWRRCLSRQ